MENAYILLAIAEVEAERGYAEAHCVARKQLDDSCSWLDEQNSAVPAAVAGFVEDIAVAAEPILLAVEAFQRTAHW